MANEETSKNDDESIIGEFVKCNQSLFAVMGIFGAIAIYLTQISTTEGISENEKYILSFGVAACLFLFIVFSWIIMAELFRTKRPSQEPFFIDFRNFEYVLFVVPFLILVIVVFYYIIIKLAKPLLAVMSLLNYVIGIFIFFYILDRVFNKTNKSLKWVMITSAAIIISIPIIHIIFNQNPFYQRNFFLILPIMSAMTFGAIISLFIFPLFYIDRKYGLSKWILKHFKHTVK